MAATKTSTSSIQTFAKYNDSRVGISVAPTVGLWLTVISGSTSAYSSTDAFTWTARTMSYGAGSQSRQLNSFQGKIHHYKVLEDVSNTNRTYFQTSDGINYIYGENGGSNSAPNYRRSFFQYDPSRNLVWHAACDSSNSIPFSMVWNGTFYGRTNGVGFIRDIMFYGSEIFICQTNGTSNQTIQKSTDNGASWTNVGPGSSLNFFSMATNGTVIVAAASVNNIYYSTNGGSTWTTGPSVNNQPSVRYLNGNFVCVAASGQIQTSADGMTWTSRTSGTANQLRDVAFGNGTYAVCGDSGTILTSPDLATWTSRTGLPGAASVIGIAFV